MDFRPNVKDVGIQYKNGLFNPLANRGVASESDFSDIEGQNVSNQYVPSTS